MAGESKVLSSCKGSVLSESDVGAGVCSATATSLARLEPWRSEALTDHLDHLS